MQSPPPGFFFAQELLHRGIPLELEYVDPIPVEYHPTKPTGKVKTRHTGAASIKRKARRK